MATQKKNSGSQSKSGLGVGNGIRNYMGSGSNVSDDKKRDDENVPWSLIVVVMAVLLMFFIIMPLLAFMYHDMFYATQAAVQEVKKMKELRREILEERLYGR
jgi:hypothetical protein